MKNTTRETQNLFDLHDFSNYGNSKYMSLNCVKRIMSSISQVQTILIENMCSRTLKQKLYLSKNSSQFLVEQNPGIISTKPVFCLSVREKKAVLWTHEMRYRKDRRNREYTNGLPTNKKC